MRALSTAHRAARAPRAYHRERGTRSRVKMTRMALRSILRALLWCGSVGCMHAGSWDGTSCQSTPGGGMRCYDLTSMKQQPGGPPTPADDSRTFADGRPASPPPGPLMSPPPGGAYFWAGTPVYVVTPGPVQPPPPR